MKTIHFSKNSDQNQHIEDAFSTQGKILRKFYEDRFSNPLKASPDRFCWDYWNIPDQYRLLRTPAESFFGPKLFKPFLEELLSWGRTHLGCQMISHPWLSLYLDGCHQKLHSDVPHGPWSFVYSLTPWKQKGFRGGETLLARPKLLRYFQEIRHTESHEEKDFFQKIEPKMNRLTVFDPRYPHGVEEVRGATDQLDARVVIHGWFTEPRPMIEGALTFKQALKPMDQFAISTLERTDQTGATGLLCVRLHIAPEGHVESAQVVTNHLINEEGYVLPKRMLTQIISESLEPVRFAKARGQTLLTIPLEIKR